MDLKPCEAGSAVKQQLTSMPGRLPLDEDTFQHLLSAAYVLQEDAGRARPKPPGRQHTQTLSEEVSIQSLLPGRQLDPSRRIDHDIRRAAGEPILPDPATESCFASTRPAESIVPNLRAKIQAPAPKAKSRPRDYWTSLLKAIVIAMALLDGWMVGNVVGWQQVKDGVRGISSAPAPRPQVEASQPAQKPPVVEPDVTAGENIDQRPVETAPRPQVEASEPAQKPPVVESDVTAGEESIDQSSVETRLASPPPAARSTVAADDGSQELLIAQRYYLEGTTGSRDATEAAKWLWKAVGKQNPRALVMLSDLYLRGDGVPRSCDQARLLLVAAVKKNAPEAAERLRRVELNGCP
jgi:hypothetical protein